MDKIKAFFEAMTIWNWLALIAFIFFPLSALNAFFSLRSRYRDWKGIQSKKQFHERLKYLEKQIDELEELKADPQEFYFWLIIRSVHLFTYLSLAISMFSAALMMYTYPFESQKFLRPFSVVPSIMAFVTSYCVSISTLRLLGLIRRVHKPVVFVDNIMDFIQSGVSKGLKTDDVDRILNKLASSKFLQPTKIKEISETLNLDAGAAVDFLSTTTTNKANEST